MSWKSTGSMIILGTLVIVFLQCNHVVGECGPGQEEVTLTPTNKIFGLHVAMNKFEVNPYNAVMGTNRKIKIANGDLFIIDSNGNTFTIKKLCLTVKGAEEVDIVYFGYGLLGQVGRDSQTFRSDIKRRICSRKIPKIHSIRGLWLRFKNERVNSQAHSVMMGNISLLACMTSNTQNHKY